MINVLHINCNYLDSKLHQLMVEKLKSLGVENRVFVPLRQREGHSVDPKEYVRPVVCFNQFDRFVFPVKQMKIVNAIEKTFSIGDYDILHAYTLFTDGNVARQLWLKHEIPYVVAVRNTDVNVFFKYRILLRRRGVKIMRDAQKVFFLSPSYRDYVIEHYVPKKHRDEILKKAIIMPNGIDDFWLDNKYLDRNTEEAELRMISKKANIIYVGEVSKNKNISLSCKAITLLKNEGWDINFSVIGDVIDNTEIDKNQGSISYYSAKPKEELIAAYRKADLFVMTSHKESFGLVYAEAMSQGLPVIYTRGQGFDRQFEDGLIGYAVNDIDPEETQEAIKRIAGHYSELSRNAIEYVERFRWTNICKEYVRVYERVTESKTEGQI